MTRSISDLISLARADPGALTPGELSALKRWQTDQEKAKAAKDGGPAVDTPGLAGLLGVSTRTIFNMRHRGDLPEPGEGGRYDLRAVVSHLHQVLCNARRERASSGAERYRTAKARMAELELKQMEGDLLERDDVERMWSRHAVDAKNLLLNVPEQVALLVPAEQRNPVRERARQVVDNALKTLQGEEEE